MLYDCWLQVAGCRRHQLALLDLSTGRRWTFSELATAGGQGGADVQISHPTGNSADFVVTVLRAWRLGRVVCPVEAGQPLPAIKGDVPAAIVHLKTTSATTGTPQVVAFTASQLKADVDNIVETMGLRCGWPNLGLISLAHSYGFSNLVLPLLLHGVPLFLAPSALPEALRFAAQAAPDVTIAGVPALWRTWHNSNAIPGNLRLAISAGAPLPLELEQEVLERSGVKIHNFYGSSECGGIAYDASDSARLDAACAGTPMHNVQVNLAEDGCVEVRGPAVAETYWPQTSQNLRNGVFRTGDLGEINAGGICLRGRATDQINIAGRKVAPEVIERVLATHPKVRACLAFGVPGTDIQRGETIVACVAPTGQVTGDSLRQFALSHLPAWQVPRKWWLVDALDVNHRGKLSRAEWRKRYLESAGVSGEAGEGKG